MTLIGDITQALVSADQAVESTIGESGTRAYALEAGIRICAIPAVRAARIDSAVLIGCIFNMASEHRHAEYHEIATAIVAEFRLDEVTW